MENTSAGLLIQFIPREKQHSEYDWADLSLGDQPVGKVRCKIENFTITIFSINVYPEWKSHGFGTKFVEYCKKNFRKVIADLVRPTAVTFWEKVGFSDNHDGTWVFKR